MNTEGLIVGAIIAIVVVFIVSRIKGSTKCKITLDDDHPIVLDDMTIILWAQVTMNGNYYEVYEDKDTFDDDDADPMMYVVQIKKGGKKLKTPQVLDGKMEQKVLDVFWAQLKKENKKTSR